MEFISSFSVGLITKEQINFYLSNGYLVIKETRAGGGGGGWRECKRGYSLLCFWMTNSVFYKSSYESCFSCHFYRLSQILTLRFFPKRVRGASNTGSSLNMSAKFVVDKFGISF